MTQEKLTALLTSKGYSSHKHLIGLELPETSLDTAVKSRFRLGPNSIEFFGHDTSLSVKTGFFQMPLPNRVYYDPNTQDVWYRVAMMPLVSIAGYAAPVDMWQRKPASDFITEIEKAPSKPVRPMNNARKWLSKFLSQEND